MTDIVYLNGPTARRKLRDYEKKYPYFLTVANDLSICCSSHRTNYIADEYGWGVATSAWEDYASLRWLLGEDADDDDSD